MGIKSTNQTEKLYKTNHPTYSTVETTTKIAKKKADKQTFWEGDKGYREGTCRL